MLLKGQWMSIHVLKAQGLKLRAIARRLGVSRKHGAPAYLVVDDLRRYKLREARPIMLDPFHHCIRESIRAAVLEWIFHGHRHQPVTD